ncbi:putative E3 ubiquitin-protein ligase RING1a isoform X3 [Gossypium hirsutum]|uniref:E3 ubiquitin-protein ligase RING1a isoform X3 n=1 Tax=Gossypium hirsutum TaxID=3635 RepID=A0ABM3BW33_GOSHI|nr:putative E3 ubiquitin-protein ligase RING1a isoform X3 [Gossypium hirsutum]XP_040971267.1 putative E3 ubiquitin-protein ligase RING1a isoform X3 [Gossypium hirsutum]
MLLMNLIAALLLVTRMNKRIIRKTRTVMECLHRFCRECIDKSMRMGNNECPACRTHCASRRSLRDDPNYDSLIAALYPDIDKHEEEELTLHEEEKARNKEIQASIAQTLHRQLEVLGRKRTVKANASATMRRSNCRYQRRRKYRTSEPQDSDSNEDTNENGSTGSSLADEDLTEVKPKRLKRWEGRCSQPSSAASADGVGDENDSEVNRESLGVSAALSPSERLHLGASGIRSHTAYGSLSGDENDSEVNRESLGLFAALNGLSERLHWGAGGMRSNTRHGSLSGGNGKKARNSRLPKLVDCLQNLEEEDDELDIHLMLVSIDEQRIPCLQRPYLCCRPTLLVRHLCKYVALQTALQASEIEIYLVKELYSTVNMSTSKITKPGLVESVRDKLQVLKEEETLGGLGRQTSSHSHLILAYQKKENRNGQCQV